ncbi:methyltransferase domain-containing protein [Flavobacterium sp. NKUCC04_CG]|nr:methyltransferase domain-containing protein [Flavobacterium sp. NKUCC04_CG]
MVARFLSFFIPIKAKVFSSKINDTLEVSWNNGKLVLDTPHTNYSYGNLQKILRKGLQTIGFHQIKKMQSVLVLGLGAGSVIHTLRRDIGFGKKITSVELDPTVLDIAKKYFKLDEFENHEIILGDAFEFALKNTRHYDLILVDIFQDAEMPGFLFESYFVHHLQKMMRTNSYLLFNTITLVSEHTDRNTAYLKLFDSSEYYVRRLSKIQNHNEIIIIRKL